MSKYIFLLFSVSMLISCTTPRNISLAPAVNVTEAYQLAKKKVWLIDVREVTEVSELSYKVKRMKNIPLSEIENRLAEMPKNEPIILACRSGKRSGKAFEILRANGFSNIANMEGGMLAWEEKGLPVEHGQIKE